MDDFRTVSANTDDFGERIAHIEGTVEQMDKRLADPSKRMDERFDTLQMRMGDRFEVQDTKIDDTRSEIRNWLVFVILVVSVGIGSRQLVLYL